MGITEKDIEYIAELARLGLTNEEKKRAQKDLDAILDYIEKLNQLDTSNIPITTHMTADITALRNDEEKLFAPCDEIIKNGPKKILNYFAVPKIIQ